MSEMGDLRDRIATLLGGELHVNLLGNGYGVEDLCALADAVVTGLGLTAEWGALDPDDNGILGDTRSEVEDGYGGTIKIRYLTSWQDAPHG